MRTDLLNSSAVALNQLRYATFVSSQNINNADNPYFSRSIVVFGMDESGFLSAKSERLNNFFLTTQVHSATAGTHYSDRYLSFASSVDRILTGITPTEDGSSVNPILGGIDDIGEALNALATTDSTSARASLLSRLGSLLSNVNSMQKSLSEFKDQISAEVSSNAAVLQNQAKQLAEINKKLQTNPNDNNLLTQRDTVLGEMSKLVNIDVKERDNGMVDVSIAGGYSIVDGIKFSEVTAKAGAYGDDVYLSINGDVMTDPKKLGGIIGGNVAARETIINEAERGIAKTVLGFYAALNEANAAGFKKDGTSGGELISIPDSIALANNKNTGTGNLSISLDQAKVSELSAGPIEIEKTAAGYLVTDKATGKQITSPTSPIEAFGFKFEVNGSINVGDKFIADPLANMLKGTEVVAKPDDIAAASTLPVTSGDTGNLQNLLGVMDAKLFNDGKDSIHDQVSNVFVEIGNRHVSAKHDLNTNKSIFETASMRWSNLSGVNTQEEELNMMKFQQIYQSVSKVIEADKKMFESIIGIL